MPISGLQQVSHFWPLGNSHARTNLSRPAGGLIDWLFVVDRTHVVRVFSMAHDGPHGVIVTGLPADGLECVPNA